MAIGGSAEVILHTVALCSRLIRVGGVSLIREGSYKLQSSAFICTAFALVMNPGLQTFLDLLKFSRVQEEAVLNEKDGDLL